jgi:hypothetical protein
VVGQKLRICGKPWWQDKGHRMPSTLLIFLSLRLCLFWKLDLNSAEELHLQSRPRVPLAHRFTLMAINLRPTLPNIVTPPQTQPAKVLANLCHAEPEVIHSLSRPTMANTVTQAGLSEVFHVSHQS